MGDLRFFGELFHSLVSRIMSYDFTSPCRGGETAPAAVYIGASHASGRFIDCNYVQVGR